MLEEDALAMLRFDEGTRMSLSSGYMPGDDLPLYMYGVSEYRAPLSNPIVVAYSGESPRSIGADE